MHQWILQVWPMTKPLGEHSVSVKKERDITNPINVVSINQLHQPHTIREWHGQRSVNVLTSTNFFS